MFAPTRDEARWFFFETWRRYKTGAPLEGLQQTALEISLIHPEYHGILDEPERYANAEWPAEAGTLNPFLHLSLHLAVHEQLSIDQPRGIRQIFDRLRTRLGDEHEALHDVIDCLGQTVWEAQRNALPPDEAAYLDCLQRRVGRN